MFYEIPKISKTEGVYRPGCQRRAGISRSYSVDCRGRLCRYCFLASERLWDMEMIEEFSMHIPRLVP